MQEIFFRYEKFLQAHHQYQCLIHRSFLIDITWFNKMVSYDEKWLGLNPTSKQIIYFRFPRACVRNYTMRALLQNACTTTKCVRFYEMRALLKMCA